MAEKKKLKDPEGGLTAAGRAYFKKKFGADLKPGVKSKEDTPEKMRRKGSFLRRHYANLRGPLKNAAGEPTRLALAAQAWGERVPTTLAAAKKLAAKGSRLLERYKKWKESGGTQEAGKKKKKSKSSAKKPSAAKSKSSPTAKGKTKSKTKTKSKAKGRGTAPAKKKKASAR